MAKIEINQLTKVFEHVTALDQVTLELEAGKRCGGNAGYVGMSGKLL